MMYVPGTALLGESVAFMLLAGIYDAGAAPNLPQPLLLSCILFGQLQA